MKFGRDRINERQNEWSSLAGGRQLPSHRSKRGYGKYGKRTRDSKVYDTPHCLSDGDLNDGNYSTMMSPISSRSSTGGIFSSSSPSSSGRVQRPKSSHDYASSMTPPSDSRAVNDGTSFERNGEGGTVMSICTGISNLPSPSTDNNSPIAVKNNFSWVGEENKLPPSSPMIGYVPKRFQHHRGDDYDDFGDDENASPNRDNLYGTPMDSDDADSPMEVGRTRMLQSHYAASSTGESICRTRSGTTG